MKVKLVSLEDILKPKSEKEIEQALNKLTPDEMLFKASKFGLVNFVKKALELGADVHANDDGALQWASGKGHVEVVKVLLGAGADVHAYNDEALRLASENGHVEVVKLLKKRGSQNEFQDILSEQAIEKILKPKTKSEIEKGLAKLSGDDLYDLWRDTGEKEYLKRGLKKGIKSIGKYDIAEILEEISEDSELEEILIPYIVKDFHSDLELKKTKKGYLLVFGWHDFADLFAENREISKNTIEKILSGEAHEIFERYDDWIKALSDVHLGSIKLSDSFNKEFKKLISKRLKKVKKNPKILKDKNSFNDLFEYLEKHENDPELEDIIEAVKFAIYDTQEIADEVEAYDELKNAIKEEFNFGDPKVGDDKLVLTIDKETILHIFKMSYGIIDKIKYYPPRYGWSGEISKYPEDFQDSLSNRIDGWYQKNIQEAFEKYNT